MVKVSNRKIKVLGISAYYHDSAACLVVDGEVIAAAHEERFTRKKHDASFPKNALAFCLETGNLRLAEVDAVIFYDKPLIKFERLIETYLAFAPRGLQSFISSATSWIKEKLFLRSAILKELQNIGEFNPAAQKLLFSEHHLSHAASAFYPSPFDEAAIVTIDGVGEWATTTICRGKGKEISLYEELHFPHSLGLLYSAFTYYLGFKVNSGEYKLMGLAPYGNPESAEVDLYIEKIKSRLVQTFDDGSITLNQEYFNYAIGLTMVNESKWKALFNVPARKSDDELTQQHCNLALAIQRVTNEIVLKIVRHAKQVTGSDNLCLAGGVALNCVANAQILKEKVFKKVWIQPAAGDAGGALGAALAAYYIYFSSERDDRTGKDGMQGSYLGPEYSNEEAKFILKKYKPKFTFFESSDELFQEVAELIAQGNVIGWFQGRMEWGPRALGNRSILADPRNTEMQKKLNLKIKYRESFRPFAGSLLDSDVGEYFEMFSADAPYMLIVADILEKHRNNLPRNYHELSLKEKLYFVRSVVPAVTHLDFSCRLQTVNTETNPRFAGLIRAFKQKTGCGIIINTSFNVRGEPIVCTPEDAYRCFMNTEMDYLVIGDLLFNKQKQPAYERQDYEKHAYAED